MASFGGTMIVIAGHVLLDPAKRDPAITAAREMMV
jgi:hypothetical protein